MANIGLKVCQIQKPSKIAEVFYNFAKNGHTD